MSMPDYDIVIVGGGMVGASLACALGNSGLRIAVIEAVALGDPGQPSYDDRTIALAYSSRRIFEGIGVWESIAQRSANPIEHIHISDKGHFGFTRLHASDMDIEALGYVAETRALGAALYEVMASYSNITLVCPAKVVDVKITENTAELSIESDGKIEALKAAAAYSEFCRDIGEQEHVVAIAWTLMHPAVSSAIVGVRTLSHLDGLDRAASLKLDDEQMARLDEIFNINRGRPLRSNESPAAYAW